MIFNEFLQALQIPLKLSEQHRLIRETKLDLLRVLSIPIPGIGTDLLLHIGHIGIEKNVARHMQKLLIGCYRYRLESALK